MNLITIVHCLVSTGASQLVIVLSSICFIVMCIYLHFNIYNRAIKPTLLEFVILLLFITAFYTGVAFLLFQLFTAPRLDQTSYLKAMDPLISKAE